MKFINYDCEMFMHAGFAYNIEQHQRNTRLLSGQSVSVIHQFLHHRQLSDQLRYLLWNV